ncbi:MAG: hypothetical protein ACLFRG_11330 [Desulfococcaceae bacterium]
MKNWFFVFLVTVAAGLLFPTIAPAQGGRPDNEFDVETFYYADGELDIDGDSGAFRVMGFRAGIEIGWLVANYGYRLYDWDDVSLLPFGDGAGEPWEDLHSAALGFSHDEMVNQSWGYFVRAQATTAFEEEMDDGFGALGLTGLMYNLPEWNMMFRLGAAYSWNEVTSRVFPLVGVNWGGRRGSGLSVALGVPLTAATYRFSERTAVRARVGFDSETFRLADDNPASPKGYLETEDIGGEIALLHNLTPTIRLTVAAGYLFDRTLTLYDSDGEGGAEFDAEEAATARAQLSFSF